MLSDAQSPLLPRKENEMTQTGAAKSPGAERKRIEAVVETLATLQSQGESLAAVAHDARNMVTALGLYCDLLEEPGVLAAPYLHYGSELRLVAGASRRLVEKLVALDQPTASQPSFWRNDAPATGQWPLGSPSAPRAAQPDLWDALPSEPMTNLAAELLATRNLLSALAGPAFAVTLDAQGGALPVRLATEDLTRVLVNLIKNAVEAMPAGGRIQIGLREETVSGSNRLILTVEDNGPGIPPQALEQVFASGFSTHAQEAGSGTHRGLGLAIARGIVEAAGGRIRAECRALGGARIVIELPVVESGRPLSGH
jgi:signal transduction histidine kinase